MLTEIEMPTSRTCWQVSCQHDRNDSEANVLSVVRTVTYVVAIVSLITATCLWMSGSEEEFLTMGFFKNTELYKKLETKPCLFLSLSL